MTEGQVSKWTIRPGFVIGLLVLFGMGWYFLIGDIRGGQSLESPDGRFNASVWRKLDGGPFDFSIREVKSENVVIQFVVRPVNGKPDQDVRGGPRIFEWSEDSSQLKIKFDDRLWGTIEVDQTKK